MYFAELERLRLLHRKCRQYEHPERGILQLGYAACAVVCPYFDGGVGAEDFWWTPLADGAIYAATWVDFNGDGTHDKPSVGTHYYFSIELFNANLSSAYWRFCVKDLNGTYAGQTSCRDLQMSYSPKGLYPWWSYERQNGASAIGHLSGYSSIKLRQMKWSSSGAANATTMTGTPTIYYKHNSTYGTGCGFSYVGCYITTSPTNSYTQFYVYTASHQ